VGAEADCGRSGNRCRSEGKGSQHQLPAIHFHLLQSRADVENYIASVFGRSI
jgi:hypothetical protein